MSHRINDPTPGLVQRWLPLTAAIIRSGRVGVPLINAIRTALHLRTTTQASDVIGQTRDLMRSADELQGLTGNQMLNLDNIPIIPELGRVPGVTADVLAQFSVPIGGKFVTIYIEDAHLLTADELADALANEVAALASTSPRIAELLEQSGGTVGIGVPLLVGRTA